MVYKIAMLCVTQWKVFIYVSYQGVRQGSVLSPWLYMCYNNDIPEVLHTTRYGITIGDINCDSVLVADDITLVSLRGHDLQRMIDATVSYSNKWRFEFNSSKTNVVTFGKSTQLHNVRKNTRRWFLKNEIISEKSSWDHVGIELSENFSSTERYQKAVAKSNAVVASLMGAGVRAGGINPLCGINIWKSFGIPAMLYGSELWN